MQYTTCYPSWLHKVRLFYQDFKDTFVCNTQLQSNYSKYVYCCFIRISKILLYAIHNQLTRDAEKNDVVLSGFQRYFCMQYTTGGGTDPVGD